MYPITPIKFYNPTFGIFFNNVNDTNGELKYRGDTVMCRDDLYFPEVVDFLDNKYKNVPKVNVIIHACSDGEEVYSFLGVLISKLKEKAAKFLPLTAKDINSKHIKLAQKGIYNITMSEYMIANDCMNGDFYNYFKLIPRKRPKDPRLKYTTTVKVDNTLKSLVNFSQGNILEDVQKADLKNTVLFARNFWPYLSAIGKDKLAQYLSEKMDPTSTLIIGDYDKEEAHIDWLLKNYGFVETKIKNVYEISNKRKQENINETYASTYYQNKNYYPCINYKK